MKKNVITISREFGSGGRTIGKAVAETLGIPYYDAEIIARLSEETGLSEKYLQENGEYGPASKLFGYSLMGRNSNGMSLQDYVFVEQSKLIRGLAEKGPCVIVGRGADYILDDRIDTLNVFIYAPTIWKEKRIVEKYGETTQKPEKRLREKDKKRAANYNYCTNREWGARHNYDMMLNSAVLGIDTCVRLIVEAAGSDGRESEN